MSNSKGEDFKLNLDFGKDVDEKVYEAELLLSSNAAAAVAIAKTQSQSMAVPADLSVLAEVLERKSRTKGTGEEMLHTQAVTLDLVFNQLLGQAMDQSELSLSEPLLKLAFKAQAQSKATFMAISDIRHPRITNNIGQVNNSSGHQQVNNRAGARGKFCDCESSIEKAPNKLSEGLISDIYQDIGASANRARKDKPCEAMEELYRADNGRRKD